MMKPPPIIFVLLIFISGCASQSDNAVRYETMIDDLQFDPIKGFALDPVTVVVGNEYTQKIIQEGSPIIPYLTQALKADDITEVIYVVYCLNELGAPDEAFKAVQQLQNDLQSNKRFNSEEGDKGTLELQCRNFIVQNQRNKNPRLKTASLLKLVDTCTPTSQQFNQTIILYSDYLSELLKRSDITFELLNWEKLKVTDSKLKTITDGQEIEVSQLHDFLSDNKSRKTGLIFIVFPEKFIRYANKSKVNEIERQINLALPDSKIKRCMYICEQRHFYFEINRLTNDQWPFAR